MALLAEGWPPAASVTGDRPGDLIARSEPEFTRLSAPYLDAVQAICTQA